MADTPAEKPPRAPRRKASWSMKHGPIAGAFNSGMVVAAIASLNQGFGLGITPWWAPAFAAAGAVATHVDAHHRGLGATSRMYRAACWAAAGAWGYWALQFGTWDVNTLVTLVLGMMVAAILAPAAATHEKTLSERRAEDAEDSARLSLAQEWERRIKRVCKVQAQVEAIEDWMRPDPEHPGHQRQTGYTVEVNMPSGGHSWETLSKKKTELANDLDLPEGCSIVVGQGISRRKALIEVSTVNLLVGDIPLPDRDRLPATINDPLPVGLHPDGSYVDIPLRWTSGVLVGAKRQGKSNLLKGAMRQALRCDDVLIFGIDFNGGAVFKPFLRPWLEGRTKRPSIDWVATNEAEAMLMLNWLIGGVSARRSGYSDYMWSNGGDDKLQVSHEIPHVLLVTDETKDVPVPVKDALVQLNNRCGAASFSMLTSWLRAVANTKEGLPTDLLAQSETAISVRVNADNELKRLFGFSARVPPSNEAPAPGWGHFAPYNGEVPRLYKAARSEDEDAYREAIATDQYRPLMDALTVDGAGRAVYEGRWERAVQAGWLKATPVAPLAPAGSSPQPVASASASGPRRSREDASSSALDAKNKLRRLQGKPEVDGFGDEPPAPPEQPKKPLDFAEEFAAIVAGVDLQGRTPEFLVAVLEVFDEVGRDRVWRSVLAERLVGGNEDTITSLLTAVGVATLPNSFRMPGEDRTGRGYARSAVEEVVEAIQTGRMDVPASVSQWRPPA